MKWLYPNFLRKIDHYLKINHPHIWRTRVHDFGWFSLVLGNLLAVVLGVLIVGDNIVLSVETVRGLFFSSWILLVFVCLFWARRLLQFNIKSTNFKTMITTWFVYVLCIVLIGFNVVTFISTIAYRTANLYPGELVEADYDYIGDFINANSYKNKDYPFSREILKEEHRTEDLLSVMARHGYEYGVDKKIHKYQMKNVYTRVTNLRNAEKFVQHPILNGHNNHQKRSFHRIVLLMNWVWVAVSLFFLPTILFLLSFFGLRNALVSIFCTALIYALVTLFVGIAESYYEPIARLLMLALIMVILGIYLPISQLRAWSYLSGVFMLMLGVVPLTLFIETGEIYLETHSVSFSYLIAGTMICFLAASLLSVWLIAKRNEQPILH